MRPIHLPIRAIAFLCPVIGAACCAVAQSRSTAEQNVVAATVDGEPIYLGDVDRLLAKVAGKQEINPAVLPMLQAGVLAEIVDRRLVLAYAKRRKTGATAGEVDASLAELKSKVQRQGSSLKRFLQERSIGEDQLRRQLAWNLTWEKYRARYVTDARLQSHFKEHRRQFDGTRLVVSQILLRPEAGAGSEAISDLVKRAEAIRREITSGKLSFAEAARKHSTAPSAKEGGRLGQIGRQGPMVEAFSRAAFELDVGQISPPVTTRFGVHLIRCDEIIPGRKQWTEVREELEKALARELLRRLAQNQRRYSTVRFTGKVPYFEPGTIKLVVP